MGMDKRTLTKVKASTEKPDFRKLYKHQTEILNEVQSIARLGLFEFDLINNDIKWSDELFRINGVERESFDLTFENTISMIHDEDREDMIELLSKAAEEGGEYQNEFRIITRNNELRYISGRGRVIIEEGRPILIGTAQDITELKMFENELVRSKEMLESINESVKDGIYQSVPDHEFQYVNQAFLDMFGYEDLDDLQRVSPSDLYADQGKREEIRDKISLTGSISNEEVLFKRKDGTWFWGAMSSIIKKDEKGDTYYNGVVRDISDLKNAHNKLLEQTEQNKKILHTINNGYLLINKQGKILDANPAISDILGIPEKEILKMAYWELEDSLDQQRFDKRFKEFTKSGLLRYEAALNTSDDEITAEISSSVIELNKQPYIVLFIQDITKRKKAEDKLKARQEDLKTTLKELSDRNFELDQLVYKVSHDLRSPLSSILGLINIFDVEEDTRKKKEYLDLIKNRVAKLDGFVKSMLNWTKANRIDIQVAPLDFENIIKNCLADLEYVDNFKKVKLTYEIRGEHEFHSDLLRLQIIFNNIISNAYKYIRPDISDNELKIDVEIREKDCVIRFQDNGIGIPEEFHDKIFEMFFRASDRSEGSGLGMYIVKQLVDMLEGTIKINGSAGVGTSIVVTLPNLFQD